MRPEMDPNFSKLRLIFRPKLLLLGWWGDASPPSPPLNPPLLLGDSTTKIPVHARMQICVRIEDMPVCDFYIKMDDNTFHIYVKKIC